MQRRKGLTRLSLFSSCNLLGISLQSGPFSIDAQLITKEEVKHFKLTKVGPISVGPSGGEFSSPSDLHDQLSKLADEKGGKYYVITAAGLTRSRLNALRADTARFKKRLFIHFRCGFKVRAMLTRSGDHVVLSAFLIGQLGAPSWPMRKAESTT